jgi:hypothetical protein
MINHYLIFVHYYLYRFHLISFIDIVFSLGFFGLLLPLNKHACDVKLLNLNYFLDFDAIFSGALITLISFSVYLSVPSAYVEQCWNITPYLISQNTRNAMKM